MFDSPRPAALGILERQVMDVMWSGGGFSVRDAQARLPRRVAYTTVMTTLDRLYKKGFVVRARQGRAFLYSPARSREEAEAAAADGILRSLLSSGSEAARPFSRISWTPWALATMPCSTSWNVWSARSGAGCDVKH